MKAVISVVSVIGLLIALEGILFLIKPEYVKKLISFFVKGKSLYLAAVLRIAIGVVFLIFAMSCHIPWLVIAFGLLAAFAGIIMFIIKLEKQKAYLLWWQQRSLLSIRLIALLTLAIGAIIFYAGWPK